MRPMILSTGGNVEAVDDQRRGLREEHRTHEDHQADREDAHELFGAFAQVAPHRLGKALAVVTQRDDSRHEIVHRTHEDAAEGDPQEGYGAVSRSQHGPEDRAQAGNVEQLDQKDPPARQGNVIHTVVKTFARSFCRGVDFDQFFQIAAINKIRTDKQCQADKKGNHCI